jgi:O-antigen/teichoic acid export membrane protein
MSSPAESRTALPADHELGRRALSLGAANSLEFAIQFLLPVVLTRCLDADAFGQYRLLWLAVGTVMAIANLAMPATLYYYLPRSDGATQRLYINQTLLYLALAGLLAGWAVSAWNPWLPENLRGLVEHQAVVPAFVVLWVIASLLDLLPTIEERIAWQAKAIVGLALLRAVALSLVAAATRELGPVLLVLFAFVVFKLALLLGYVAKHHGLRGPIVRWGAFAGQLRYAAPFGASGVLYGLRAQADQWVAAALFPLGMFASFSIAAVLGGLMNLCRMSINYTFLPSMSRLQAAGNIAATLELNSRANTLVGALVYPLLAFAFVFAEELITLVYTGTYLDAAPVMRVYIAGLAALVVELASITLLLRQGAFVLVVNAVSLAASVAINVIGALRFGLAGAALGTVITIFADRIATLARISRHTGIPLGRLQDWRALGLSLAFAALAAALAWAVTDRFFAAAGPLARVTAGGLVLAVAYASMVGKSQAGRDWIAMLRAARPER